MAKGLQIGDWIKDNIIGPGFYEIVGISDYHVNVKCLKIFGGKNPEYRGHVTSLHRGIDKATGERIIFDHQRLIDNKVRRLN